jgi:hypothetical protein
LRTETLRSLIPNLLRLKIVVLGPYTGKEMNYA